MKGAALIFSLLLFIGLQAQSPHFHQIELLRKNEAVQINVIYPDQTGYIWVGTNKGLFRFDGIQSTQFKKENGLSDENITSITEDSVGRIWCGHKNGTISIVEHIKVSAFQPSEGSATGLVSDILFDQSGVLWFSTNNDGLYYYVNERLYRIDEQEGLPDLFLYDLEEDNHGNIWAATDAGIAICKLQGAKLSIEVIADHNGLPDNIIHKIRQDEDGTFWLGTEDAGIIHYYPSEKKFEIQDNIPLLPVNDFIVEENNIWIATQRPGILLYSKDSKTLSTFDAELPIVDALARDAEGNIWYGSREGLFQSYGNHLSFLDLRKDMLKNNVFALVTDLENNLWFSSEEGLFLRAWENGKYSIKKYLKGTPYEKWFIISLYADHEGFIWAGSYGQGLLRINLKTGATRHFLKEIRNGNILNITGKDRTVWIATLGGITKIEWEKDSYEIENIGSQEGLATDYIYQVFMDSRERVWLATDGKGVDMMDEKGIHHFSQSLNSKVVYGFAEDHLKQIWANVQNDGLHLIEGGKEFQSDSTLGFRHQEISCLIRTQSGNLLMMNDFGLEFFDVQKKQRHYLGTERDFEERHPNLNAVARDTAGNIYFGTEGGIVIYHGGIRNLPVSPAPHIENLKVANQTVELKDELVFDYQENNITFNYLGFWYQNPGAVTFQYQLENYDHEWIKSRDRTATYSNLPPGDYTFKLKASNDELFSSEQIASVHFIIQPPFWKRIWFYVLCFVLAGAGVYGFIHYREKKLLADKHELEEKVKERTAEILKMNHEIRHQAEEIKAINDNLEKLVLERTKELERKNKALEEAAFINAHNLRSPVASLLGLINLVKKLRWHEDDKEYIHHLEKSADKLDEVVSTITQAIGKGDDIPTEEDEE